MKVIKTNISDVVILDPRVFGDERGYFFESFSQREFNEQVAEVTFVQDNESKSSYGVVTINTIILLLSIWTMNSFTFIFILTEGGPAHHSEILSLYIYNAAFGKYDFGQASAASVVLFALTALIALLYNRYIIGGEKE